MPDRKELEQIKAAIIAEAEEDFIGLWEIVREVRETTELNDEEAVRSATLAVVEDLVRGGQIRAGVLSGDGRELYEWAESAELVIERINREWLELGRDPNIGEIAWFDLAPR